MVGAIADASSHAKGDVENLTLTGTANLGLLMGLSAVNGAAAALAKGVRARGEPLSPPARSPHSRRPMSRAAGFTPYPQPGYCTARADGIAGA